MQLKIKRSQREGGVLSKTVIFCLDARVEFTSQERQNLQRYKLYNQAIYNSERSKKHLERADSAGDRSAVGELKALAFTALAAMHLNITVSSLEQGQHVECKSLDELLGAESAIMTACENLKGYLDMAATFDGREVLIDFAAGTPEVVAQAAAPSLITSPASTAPPRAQAVPAPPPAPQPAIDPADAPMFAANLSRPQPALAGASADSWGTAGNDDFGTRIILGSIAAGVLGIIFLAFFVF